MILINVRISLSYFSGLYVNCLNKSNLIIWIGFLLIYDQFSIPNVPWCRCILFRCILKAKFSNLHNKFKVISNIISLWAWPLFSRCPYVAETLIYWLGFQWVQLRVERGKGGLIYNFVLNHIYFRNLAHQQKDASGGGDGTPWPTNINQNSSTYCFNLIRSLYSVCLILRSKERLAEPSPQSDWLWAGIRFLAGITLTLKLNDDRMTRF
jgi:hypothetical protein